MKKLLLSLVALFSLSVGFYIITPPQVKKDEGYYGTY